MPSREQYESIADELQYDPTAIGYRGLDPDYPAIADALNAITYGPNPDPQGTIEVETLEMPDIDTILQTATNAEWVSMMGLPLQTLLAEAEINAQVTDADMDAVGEWINSRDIVTSATSAWAALDQMSEIQQNGEMESLLTMLWRTGHISQATAVVLNGMIFHGTETVPDPFWEPEVVVTDSRNNVLDLGNPTPANVQTVINHPQFPSEGVWP